MDLLENSNKDFDNFIDVKIYINGFIMIDNENDKILSLKINLQNIIHNTNDYCNILQNSLEIKLKEYIVKKMKENCHNVVSLSKIKNIPVKNILYSYFINNRIDNIEIIWSSSSIKEFTYVPIKHYLENNDDILLLKTKKFKFKNIF
jgi:hypothetical protein